MGDLTCSVCGTGIEQQQLDGNYCASCHRLPPIQRRRRSNAIAAAKKRMPRPRRTGDWWICYLQEPFRTQIIGDRLREFHQNQKENGVHVRREFVDGYAELIAQMVEYDEQSDYEDGDDEESEPAVGMLALATA